MAIAWTLLIFIACLSPSKELPHLDIPLIDKWTHFVLFGIWTFLVLLSRPEKSIQQAGKVALAGCILGWLVEELQGIFSFLGRTKDWMDIAADAIGAFLGVFLFYICVRIARKQSNSLQDN